MGSGKDTAAFLLVRSGYVRVAFADALREEVAASLGLDSVPEEMPQELFLSLLGCQAQEVYAKPTTPRMRALLQWWGLWRRSPDADWWVRRVERAIARSPELRFTIADVRFQNEVEMIRKRGGVVWLISGRGGASDETASHVSERLDWLAPDVVIDNSGDLDDLQLQIDHTMKRYAEACGSCVSSESQ